MKDFGKIGAAAALSAALASGCAMKQTENKVKEAAVQALDEAGTTTPPLVGVASVADMVRESSFLLPGDYGATAYNPTGSDFNTYVQETSCTINGTVGNIMCNAHNLPQNGTIEKGSINGNTTAYQNCHVSGVQNLIGGDVQVITAGVNDNGDCEYTSYSQFRSK